MRVLKLPKWLEVFQSSFHMTNLKSWSPKKYEDKEPNMHNPNQFMASQNLLYNSFKWISNVIFFLQSSVFETHFQESSILQKVKIAMHITTWDWQLFIIFLIKKYFFNTTIFALQRSIPSQPSTGFKFFVMAINTQQIQLQTKNFTILTL